MIATLLPTPKPKTPPLTLRSYQVEAVDADGFCVSAESNCATATPVSYHATSVGAGVMPVATSMLISMSSPGSSRLSLSPTMFVIV